MKVEDKPHARNKACGAKTRKSTACQGLAMKNGRCRLHGGRSTGPKTKAGRARIAEIHFKHGLYANGYQSVISSMKDVLKVIK